MNNKKETKKKLDLKIVIPVATVAVVLVVAGIILLTGNKKTEPEKPVDPEPKVVEKVITEEEMIELYNYSKEDAIKRVKEYFNSDNFEFSAEIKDYKYIVTAKNTIADEKIVFEVNPVTQAATKVN